MGILGWIVLGLIAGAIAKLAGRRVSACRREPRGPGEAGTTVGMSALQDARPKLSV